MISPSIRGGWSLPGLRYTAGLPKGIYTMKKELHPKWYPDCKVNFRGQHVMTVGATVPECKKNARQIRARKSPLLPAPASR